jgi:folylpolyglutamate synthase/dihydropteroate synthase
MTIFKPKETTPPMPGYFRFVTLLAFYVFLKMKVDATILEVGVGGMYDSTNIVPKPMVTGVTALGIDHVSVLGKTLTDIAWQKGGIFKVTTASVFHTSILPYFRTAFLLIRSISPKKGWQC